MSYNDRLTCNVFQPCWKKIKKGYTCYEINIRITGNLWILLLLSPSRLRTAVITDFDSTQPRGFNELLCTFNAEVVNDQGQDLCPVEEGFRAPQRVGKDQVS